MASTEFVAVSFAPNQILDEDTMDQIADNQVYLRDQSIDGLYQNLNGGGISTGIKLIAGRAQINPRSSDSASVRVTFPSLFTPDTIPVITLGINSQTQIKVFTTFEGIGRAVPNHQGFIAHVNVDVPSKKYDKIKRMILNWQAVGY